MISSHIKAWIPKCFRSSTWWTMPRKSKRSKKDRWKTSKDKKSFPNRDNSTNLKHNVLSSSRETMRQSSNSKWPKNAWKVLHNAMKTWNSNGRRKNTLKTSWSRAEEVNPVSSANMNMMKNAWREPYMNDVTS